MAAPISLLNNFLVAMPTANNDFFSKAVIYICDNHQMGTVGLIVNRPTKFSVKLLVDNPNLVATKYNTQDKALMFGGPIRPERGLVIHRPFGSWQTSTTILKNEVTVTTSVDIIDSIIKGTGPADALVTLGYVGWSKEQLEKEIINNQWLICPFNAKLLYDVPFENRWTEAALTIGVHMDQLIPGGGHA
jgi:putative transcriptional regulator